MKSTKASIDNTKQTERNAMALVMARTSEINSINDTLEFLPVVSAKHEFSRTCLEDIRFRLAKERREALGQLKSMGWVPGESGGFSKKSEMDDARRREL